ncbi:MFS transporter [Micrococcus endophyticus]|uniref:MFS family permease n=1 Tax=Micrococcus endophyticus TaxID=455343 RepID=A0A7W9JIZ1_9MICC|nr:MFS transporter [Micrococcus endophyticus]MBB5848767.1 MFS family permease [Micrococcus endophyticus]
MSHTTTPADGTAAGLEAAAEVPRGRVITASLVGTSIEFYDFYVYATAAVSVFPLIFFPGDDQTTALLASFAVFGTAFVARPIGSVLFGHFGDILGRKVTLIGSLLTMGIATFLIGLLPTAFQIGLWAPAMLVVLRFCQGLGLGGEWSGAALLATEYAAEGKRARAAMWPQLGAPIGFLLANGLFLALVIGFGHDSTNPDHDGAFLNWVWRVPFLLSIVMVAVGLYVRVKLEETPVFQRAIANDTRVKAPLGEVFKRNWWELILGTFIMYATYVLFYLMTTWILSYAIGKTENGMLGVPYAEFLVLQLIGILFFAAFVPASGWLADRFGRKPTLLTVSALMVLFGLSFGLWLSAERMGTGAGLNVPLMVAFLAVGMALMGLTFGPMSAVLPELFPTNTRYTGSGIAYNVSSILGAALTPFLAAWLVKEYGVTYVGYYLAAASVITMIALALAPETRHTDLDGVTSARERRAASV